METAISSLISLVFFVFAFGINIVVMALRAIIEAIFKKLDVVIPDKIEGFLRDVWNEWILAAAPVVIGGLLAYFISDYPYPAEFAGSVSGRVFFGLIAGFFSASVYRFAKYHIKKYLPDEVKSKIGALAKQANVTETTEVTDETPSEPKE